MSEIADWFRSLPLLTRYWFGLSIIFPALGRFKLLAPYYLIFSYSDIIKNFEVWRIFTSVFYYPMGFHYLVNIYFLYSYSTRLETSAYSGRPAEYLFMLIFNFICIIIIAIFSEIQLLMDPMVLSVLYVWCQLNKEQIVSFWFGTRFKAVYLPWVLFAFNLILSGGGLYELIGILVGHLYFFLNFQYPQEGGRQLLHVPSILYKYFPNEAGGFSGFGQAPQRRGPPSGNSGNQNGRGNGWFSSHNWGTGQVLGRQ